MAGSWNWVRMVAQDQFKVTVQGQGIWSQVGIITWKQCRHMDVLQRHRDEKRLPEVGRHGEGCQGPAVESQGVGRDMGKPVLRRHRDRKRDAVVP